MYIWFLPYRPGNVRVCHIFSYHAIVVERMVGIGVAWPKRIFESGQPYTKKIQREANFNLGPFNYIRKGVLGAIFNHVPAYT